MIFSSDKLRSIAFLPEVISSNTIPKLKTSDFAVATPPRWKLSGDKYPIVPPMRVVSAALNR
ncbi:hypothetical protein R6Q59_024215 [Mikania micrantha]